MHYRFSVYIPSTTWSLAILRANQWAGEAIGGRLVHMSSDHTTSCLTFKLESEGDVRKFIMWWITKDTPLIECVVVED